MAPVEDVQTPKTAVEALSNKGATIEMVAINLEEFNEKFASKTFEFSLLCKQMALVCKDYDEGIEPDTKQSSLTFVGTVLYKIGPESRVAKKSGNDTCWKLKFGDNYAQVSTHKYDKPSEEQPMAKLIGKNYVLFLTVKQATLLALHKLMSVIDILDENEVIMTPLCGAIYQKDRLIEIAFALNQMQYQKRVWTLKSVCKMLNGSAQSGGHLLMESDGNAALAMTFVVTNALSDEKLRSSLINKLEKQYRSLDWEPSYEAIALFMQMSSRCTGVYADMEAMFKNPSNNYRMTAMGAIRAAKEALIKIRTEGIQKVTPDSEPSTSNKKTT